VSVTPHPSSAPIEGWEVLDLLASLVQKSLILYEEDEHGQGRYRLLETARQYARDRLLESGEGEAVRDQHRDRLLALAEEAEPKLLGPEQVVWLDRLETECRCKKPLPSRSGSRSMPDPLSPDRSRR
jgi:predicted ATPase